MRQPAIGLLPHYIELYDRTAPQLRPGVEAFYQNMAQHLQAEGLTVVTAPVCRLDGEFRAAVAAFEAAGVCGIVSLHLAYSPSLESIGALQSTALPLLLLDTTPDDTFGPGQQSDAIDYNHGIHGVQDLCSMLLRQGRPFAIEAGHWAHTDVLRRVAQWAQAAQIAAAFHSAKVGLIGQPFQGMGDFAISEAQLQRTFGISVAHASAELLRQAAAETTPQQTAAELAADRESFDLSRCPGDDHAAAVAAGLAVRRWVESQGLTAFTVNFLDSGSGSGLAAMPFAEAGKAMGRGIGYAGEGDVLTAALVGAVAQSCPETSFTEMFCPDWVGGSIFLSHMGEMNPCLAVGKPALVANDFPYSDHGRAVSLAGCFQPGPATILNLSPGPDDRFRLIAAQGTMDAVTGTDAMADCVRGWFRPQMPVADFLAAYSRRGGTHHSVLVYGQPEALFAQFAAIMGWEYLPL